MPRVANPLHKVRNRLEACCFSQANFKNLPMDMKALVDGQCEVQRFVVGEMISEEVDLVKAALLDINHVPEASS